ncbi:MAG TPA: BON domain-containing protein [Paraburkholderia sp.]|jgi:osmotically-inducible protein OsmY|nr:BON domain-containing protein [Paraburkholderia sp.]
MKSASVSISALALAVSCLIVPSAHAQTSGGDVAHQVRVALAHSGVTLSHVNVIAHGGEVVLVGFVPELPQRALAERVAATVPGVTSVDNWLGADGGVLH